jgi:hypothetical protein
MFLAGKVFHKRVGKNSVSRRIRGTRFSLILKAFNVLAFQEP